MVKRIIIAILLSICVLLLTACKSSVDYGTVTDKQYTPARQVYSPLIMTVNKQTRIIPRYIHHPQTWYIYVQNDNGGEWWNVTEDYYNSVEVGDFVDRSEKNE